MSVTSFTCILLENVVCVAACVSVSSNFNCQKASLQCVFPVFLDIICYIESLKSDIQISPCQSLKNISVTTFINSFRSAYDSTAQDFGC